jgi:Ger(x)C family germination protein
MKRICCIIISFGTLLIFSGCWDQDLLKNARLLSLVAFDTAPQGKLLGSFVIHDQPRGEQSEASDDVLYSIGSTPREARDKVDSKLSNFMRAYKNRVLLIGEERAKQDIYPLLDVFYRDPKSALNAKIAIVKGKASQLLSKKKIGNVQISEEIANLITSSEQSTFVTKADIQSICPVMLDPGEDFLLPYLSKKGDRIEASKVAMFHDHRFTGVLNPRESMMYSLLKGEEKKIARITLNMESSKKESGYNYLTFDVTKSKPNMQIMVESNKQVRVKYHVDWRVDIAEYPSDNLKNDNVLEKLERKMSLEMTHLADQTIKKMQMAQCDGFGIGRKLIAYYPQMWDMFKKNWGSHYQKIKFEPSVHVKIINTGIIN